MDLVMADSLVQERAAPRRRSWLRACLRQPMLWIIRVNARRELMNLDADQMRDSGLDPLEVRREALKPFWRE